MVLFGMKTVRIDQLLASLVDSELRLPEPKLSERVFYQLACLAESWALRDVQPFVNWQISAQEPLRSVCLFSWTSSAWTRALEQATDGQPEMIFWQVTDMTLTFRIQEWTAYMDEPPAGGFPLERLPREDLERIWKKLVGNSELLFEAGSPGRTLHKVAALPIVSDVLAEAFVVHFTGLYGKGRDAGMRDLPLGSGPDVRRGRHG
ncbi:hypothetical protein DFJ73DRAFT_507470 [Zopfochytrium polystomum]|nr:hypothetical protein DFJ73DRAFT_507470 [Zopfochytrium polystomum]